MLDSFCDVIPSRCVFEQGTFGTQQSGVAGRNDTVERDSEQSDPLRARAADVIPKRAREMNLFNIFKRSANLCGEHSQAGGNCTLRELQFAHIRPKQ